MFRSRTHRAIVGLALLALIFAACDEWPTLGFDAARTGFSPGETTLTTDNVGQLQKLWATSSKLPDTGFDSSPVVADGSVFVAAGNLRVFSADGTTGCSGTPLVCKPMWTAVQGGESTPTYANHVVYTTYGNSLYGFDALGESGCSGTPKTCQPLWKAVLGGKPGSPVVSRGVLYVGTDQDAPKHDLLYAFDAAGVEGCSSSPKVCQPLWRSTSDAGATPAVAGGLVYAATTNEAVGGGAIETLAAFDAAGTDGCSGTPKRCSPRWLYQAEDACECVMAGPPSIADGRLFVFSTFCCSMQSADTDLLTFDADGHDGCTGTEPRRCQPIRRQTVDPYFDRTHPPVAEANGLAFASALGTTVIDASTGVEQWGVGGTVSSPSIAGGLMFVVAGGAAPNPNKVLITPRAYDAAGVAGCSGSPKSCAPLWTGEGVKVDSPFGYVNGSWAAPVVAHGILYTRVGNLRAYRLPPG
ncbi:MAG: PQQ-binding-like beta-propeller repeat protein [Acidimicrobiia bacterium]|nr:PQQ-binding-like beta-propeller repeat protein [Acidimicrobiia bacterium]